MTFKKEEEINSLPHGCGCLCSSLFSWDCYVQLATYNLAASCLTTLMSPFTAFVKRVPYSVSAL